MENFITRIWHTPASASHHSSDFSSKSGFAGGYSRLTSFGGYSYGAVLFFSIENKGQNGDEVEVASVRKLKHQIRLDMGGAASCRAIISHHNLIFILQFLPLHLTSISATIPLS